MSHIRKTPETRRTIRCPHAFAIGPSGRSHCPECWPEAVAVTEGPAIRIGAVIGGATCVQAYRAHAMICACPCGVEFKTTRTTLRRAVVSGARMACPGCRYPAAGPRPKPHCWARRIGASPTAGEE